jgi:hypothetical protein
LNSQVKNLNSSQEDLNKIVDIEFKVKKIVEEEDNLPFNNKINVQNVINISTHSAEEILTKLDILPKDQQNILMTENLYGFDDEFFNLCTDELKTVLNFRARKQQHNT